MDSQRRPPETSITQIAFFYVCCLMACGLSILSAFLYAGDTYAVLGFIVIAVAGIVGIVGCSRSFARMLARER